jgi:protein gp37
MGKSDWWDRSWNSFGGCSPHSPGCRNCYAAQTAADGCAARGMRGIHIPDLTTMVRGRAVFNGKLSVLPRGSRGWTWPLRWPGARHPLLGDGKPSLIFVGDMADIFHPRRPRSVVDDTVGAIVISDHIGLIVTRRTKAMAAYFTDGPTRHTLKRWQAHLWLGFSGENQKWFDKRWRYMRPLADKGWTIFCSISPMIGPVTLPPDFLALGQRGWAICSGEEGRAPIVCRHMDPNWARKVRDQCARAGVAFFFKQMASKRPMPPDLLIRQFPRVRLPAGNRAQP